MKNIPWLQVGLFVLSLVIVVVLIAAFRWPAWLVALPIAWGPSIGMAYRARTARSRRDAP